MAKPVEERLTGVGGTGILRTPVGPGGRKMSARGRHDYRMAIIQRTNPELYAKLKAVEDKFYAGRRQQEKESRLRAGGGVAAVTVSPA